MHFKSLNLGVPEKQPLWLTSEVSSRLNRTYRSLRLLFATSAAAKLKLQLSFTSLAKATSSALSLKSPSKMEPTIVRPRPAKQDCSLLVCDFSFESVDENPMVLPFKWNLFSNAFTWCYPFSTQFQLLRLWMKSHGVTFQNETSSAVLLYSTVYLVSISNFFIPGMWPFKIKPLDIPFREEIFCFFISWIKYCIMKPVSQQFHMILFI